MKSFEELEKSPCPPKTRSDLEWDRLLSALAGECVGKMGSDLARALPFAESRAEARMLLAEAQEATALARDAAPLPVSTMPDVREAVGRLRASGVLAPAELRDVGKLLGLARVLRRHLSTRRTACPALFAACGTDPTLDELADELESSFDADGTLADRASPRLKELRGEYQASRARMLSRLEELMGRYASILQDRFVTEREGRYVVPVRSDAHERFPGIVHGTSASGSTLFVEPRAVIPMGNRLKVLEADVTREELAIYTRLSGLLQDSLPSVEACAQAMARADVRAATAKLADKLSLVFPQIVDAATMDLKNARHPLLEGHVVPSDVAIGSGRAMVISGPNAGGKTVALKTMGLAALMARAGLPVACGEGSVLGLFDAVLTDVGDDQNLHKNLSTFSAHVRNLATILEDTHEGTLVLLDELAGGTDPREGEALAAGVLDSLCARGGAVVSTTHYEGLKALALADERFQNASVGFDIATMTPTFRLAIGVPGSSSALAVARQFGLPATVIARAQGFLSGEDKNFESVVQKLNDERKALDLARHAAIAREAEATQARVRFEAELELARDREKRLVSQETEALLASLRRAREDLRSAQARLRSKKVDAADLKEASRALDRVSGDIALGGELEHLTVQEAEVARSPVRRGDLRKGARVYVPRLRAEAEVVELLAGDSVRVAAGPLKLTVSASELKTPAATAPTPPLKERRTTKPAAASAVEVAIPTSDNTVDLRGLRADDAVSLALTFLDRSLNEGRRIAFLLHGHGTGALKEAIRSELKTSPYVAHFRAAEPSDGGDGVTVVWLA